jgi:excisionase family DNA binding protein
MKGRKKRQPKLRTLRDQGWVSVAEAAKYYGVHRITIYRWLMEGVLDWRPTPGNHRKRVKVGDDDQDLFARTRRRLA